MKPGPFSDVTFVDPKTQFRVESILDKKEGQFSSSGHTVIYDNKKKKLWQSKLFTGRKKIELSPDGKVLGLIGSFYFGALFQPNSEEVIVVLNNESETIKSIKFSDVYKGNTDELIKKIKAPVMGGGWASLDDFFKEIRIDWDKKNIYIKFVDGNEFNFPF